MCHDTNAGYSFDLMSDHSSLANQLYALSPVDDGSLVPTKIHRHVSILPEIDWGSGTVVQQPAPTLSPAPAPLKEKKHKKKDKATKSSKEQPIKEEPDGGIDTPKLEENLKKKKKRSMEGPRDASTVKEAKPPKAEKKKHKASIP